MTNEQKPESAEFRTRDRQIEIMTTNYMGAGLPIKAARKLATDEVTEAEARGAAEQRRKIWGDHRPIFQVYHQGAGWSDCRHSYWAMADYPKEEKRLLYTGPANVAALEARAKELEGVNKAWSDAAANALTWIENGRQANARDELKAAQRRTAAIREGEQP